MYACRTTLGGEREQTTRYSIVDYRRSPPEDIEGDQMVCAGVKHHNHSHQSPPTLDWRPTAVHRSGTRQSLYAPRRRSMGSTTCDGREMPQRRWHCGSVRKPIGPRLSFGTHPRVSELVVGSTCVRYALSLNGFIFTPEFRRRCPSLEVSHARAFDLRVEYELDTVSEWTAIPTDAHNTR